MKKLNIEEIREYYSRSMSSLDGKIRPYIRVSSKNPGQDEARQVTAFNKFKENWPQFEYDLVYLEKSTAKGGHRTKKFKDMINAGRSNQFDILWIESVSRFARSMEEGVNKIFKILDAGIRVYIEYFGRILNPGSMEDRMYLYNMLMVAEMQNHMLQVDTIKSTAVKKDKLIKWGKEEGLLNVRLNNATMFDMWLDDPFFDAKKSPGKLGVCVTEIPHMKDIFIQFVVLGYSWSYIANYMKKPVNHKCKYGCWNGKEMPFNSKPLAKGKRGESKRVYASEVADWLGNGGWSNYVKPDSKVDPKAFNKNGTKKCGCASPQTETTICKYRKELVYDTGIAPKANPDAFKTIDAESTEVSPDELDALYLTGKVSSR